MALCVGIKVHDVGEKFGIGPSDFGKHAADQYWVDSLHIAFSAMGRVIFVRLALSLTRG